MTVPEYLKSLACTCETMIVLQSCGRIPNDNDVASLREIAARWEKMDRGLDCAVGTVTNKDGKKACPICYWADGDGHYKTCHIGNALAAARAPLGETT